MPFYVVAHLPEQGALSADLLNYLIKRKIVFSVSTEIEEVKKSFGSTTVVEQPTVVTSVGNTRKKKLLQVRVPLVLGIMIDFWVKLEPSDPDLITLDDSPSSTQTRNNTSEPVRKAPSVPQAKKQLPIVAPITPSERVPQQIPSTIEPVEALWQFPDVQESPIRIPPRSEVPSVIESFEQDVQESPALNRPRMELPLPDSDDLHAQLSAIFLPKGSNLNQIRAQPKSPMLAGNWLFGGALPRSSSDIEISPSETFISQSSDAEPVTKRLRINEQNSPFGLPMASISPRVNPQDNAGLYAECPSCKTHFPEDYALKRSHMNHTQHCSACKLGFFRSKKSVAEKEPKKPRKPRDTGKTKDTAKTRKPRKVRESVAQPQLHKEPVTQPQLHEGPPPFISDDQNRDGPPFSDDFIEL